MAQIPLLVVSMKPICEEMFKDVLPTTRAILVRYLVQKHKLSQVEVAKQLGITQPAVSQYLNLLRGKSCTKTLLKNRVFIKSLKSLSDAIASGDIEGDKLTSMYCKLCEIVRKTK